MYQKILCFEKDCSALEKIVLFPPRLLCSRKDCVPAKIVVFPLRLLCSQKNFGVLKNIYF